MWQQQDAQKLSVSNSSWAHHLHPPVQVRLHYCALWVETDTVVLHLWCSLRSASSLWSCDSETQYRGPAASHFTFQGLLWLPWPQTEGHLTPVGAGVGVGVGWPKITSYLENNREHNNRLLWQKTARYFKSSKMNLLVQSIAKTVAVNTFVWNQQFRIHTVDTKTHHLYKKDKQ